jgi:glutamate synthase domain-containing protein 2/glutamate synthase domain-containing protein 1/glutamate synthase domain-containing protein 3
MKGAKSHEIVRMGLEVLVNITHRGATGADPNTGDGAGILIQIPHEFLSKECSKIGISLPGPGDYAVGMVFLPKDEAQRRECEGIFEGTVRDEGEEFIGWRDVPTDNSAIGYQAKGVEPVIRQLFIGRKGRDQASFERRLYLIRKVVENRVRESGMPQASYFHIPSLSSRTLVYKGLLIAHQMPTYYPDLNDRSMVSALALVHQRYSTNTFPTWDLAQPFRYLAHNGEINTVRGNINWMKAREATLQSGLLGDDIKRLFPIITPGGSDSLSFDNALELMVASGRSLPHAMMMMIPEAWDKNVHVDEGKRGFYEYHAALMEPWDGPAAIAFTDGTCIGATLDRNGLRPARYVVASNGLVVMASEVGVLTFKPEEVVKKGRLEPGRMFLVDLSKGRIIDDSEVKAEIVGRRPYRKWVQDNKIELEKLPAPPSCHQPDHSTLTHRQKVFGYTIEDIKTIITPMVVNAEEPVGSMGTDTPLAVLSKKPQLTYNYFKQLFAQVTNPPIDPIREELVMSLTGYIGARRNLLDETPKHCHLLELQQPILTNLELEQLRHVSVGDFRAITLDMIFRASYGEKGLRIALDGLCKKASEAIRDGYSIIVLSDRGINREMAPIPSLLATAAAHHHLIREGTRGQVGIVVETGDAREVHHFALLIGYGAGAINPYLAFETVTDLFAQRLLPEGIDEKTAIKNFIKAADKGLLKIFSKMGISTLQSYQGAQIFEAVGLNRDAIDSYFTGTTSRIGGAGLEVIARETAMLHSSGFPKTSVARPILDVGGSYKWVRGGEYHTINPDTITKLQQAARRNDYRLYKEFSSSLNGHERNIATLRGLFRLKTENPIPIDEVEPAGEIVKRFATGAMSFGSISREAHEALAIAMNRIGGKSNSGEGGEDPERYQRDPNGDWRRSAIKQVASGRFGVTAHYLVNADELQIKMAQGAKPGEGGQLPGHKVDETIARVRHTTPGVTLISPPPHHDIYSIEDLAQLIHDLKNINPMARISVKLVAEIGVGTIAAGVSKAHADHLLISGFDGGTGASPISSIRHAGLPWELGISETHQTLVLNDLRGRIRVMADGQMKTGRDVVIAALLGAEEYGFATIALIVLGCVMMRKCHLNTCPVGVATQDPELRKRFTGRTDYLVNYFHFVAEEVRELMAQLGFRKMDEMIGRTDRIDVTEAVELWKTSGLDLSPILYRPKVSENIAIRCVQAQDHGLDKALDNKLIELAKDAIENRKPVEINLPIRNINRTVGTMLSGEIARWHGGEYLPDNTIRCRFSGTAGQSLGAFLAKGVAFELEGDANDYVGKGLSGGRIIIYPPKGSPFTPEENIIVGNTVLYGATSGEVFFRGVAGERFAVRNSGANAVVEGVGDHGCEYMTGGNVVVIGKTGRNFAAGMSGGYAFVLDEGYNFRDRCNMSMVDLEQVSEEKDQRLLKELLEKHHRYTGSTVAKRLLDSWGENLKKFVMVVPIEYRKVMAKLAAKTAS